MSLEAFSLAGEPGSRFCLCYTPDPATPLRGAAVYVHPFAEEMNKSRRMAALQAKAMAKAGYAVLQIDLLGCGDSSGDFGDATWEGWVGDVVLACRWLRERCDAPLWLWGLRTGCLLACEVARREAMVERLLFWQPVVSGKQFVQQFLRLKLAGEMLTGESKGMMERLREDLAQGRAIEVAGYSLSPALVKGLEVADLSLPERKTRVEWLELSAKPLPALSPVANQRLEKWKTSGHDVSGAPVNGVAFWQTTEITDCPALIEASMVALGRAEVQ